jgi:nicotinamide mononucleotide transporter
MEWWTNFMEQLLQTTWLEALAVITGIGSVWFSRQESILVYPVGIVSVLIYVYLAWVYQLYADSAVNFYYFLMSVYGWWNWKHTGNQANQIPISRSTRNGHLMNIFVFASSFVILAFVLTKFTDSDVPMFDAFTTSAAITAMWLMARKKIEHWIFWLICNFISIPLYTYKGLPFTSVQFVVFSIISVMGLISWRKKLLAQKRR